MKYFNFSKIERHSFDFKSFKAKIRVKSLKKSVYGSIRR